jgi:hypothetical protein
MSLANLYNIDKALVETSCDPKIQPLLGCNPIYDKVGPFAIASATSLDGDKKSIDGIDAIDGTPGASQVRVGNDHSKSNDKSTDTEYLIPSTIKAIPFP